MRPLSNDSPVRFIDCSVAPPDVPVTRPVVMIGVHAELDDPGADRCDVVVSNEEEADEVIAAVEAQPAAAVALALLLRACNDRSIADGLILESATYSALQASASHQRWLQDRPPGKSTRQDQPVVKVSRTNDRLDVTLARPERRNAYNSQMRDELLAALEVAVADPSITEIVLRGEGPVFSSGGDLDEFGTGTDPAQNHMVRLERSTAAALAALVDRVTVHIQGACVGAGVELPAFAHRIVATPDTTMRLPELAMGLIPGAGGTVSLPRRIGRHRTAWMALTGQPIGALTASEWGLVDAVQ